MAKVTSIRELRRATKTVVCPACQEKGETFRVSEPFTTAQKTTLAAASIVTAGIPVVYYLMGPRANWLAHYCRTCGIRLATYIQEGDPVFPLNSSMLETPRDSTLGSPKTNQPARYARSPLGPPPNVDFRTLANFADRYRSLVPASILDVDWNKWLDMPVTFRTLDRRTKAYEVKFIDFDPEDSKLNAVMFFPAKRDPHFIYPLIWTPERANLRIMDTKDRPEIEVGLVQLAQSEWDVGMYFPKTAAPGSPNPDKKGSAATGYDFRHQEIGTNHHVFARGHPHFVWSSSEGPLLWTVQRSADALSLDQPSEDRLILLDCYDRLVAMEHCQGHARWKDWDAVERSHVFESHLNLRFYGSLSQKIVDEIVVSYVAVTAQMRRKGEWDVININSD